MFWRKQASTQNVLLLDVESSSVGAALAHLSTESAPVLFAERRIRFAPPRMLSSVAIASQVEKALHEALAEISLVAARLRSNPKTANRGIFSRATAFLGAPWGVPNLAAGKPDFSPYLHTMLKNELALFADDLPLSLHTSAAAAAYGGAGALAGGTILLTIPRGEITELVLLQDGKALGYGTLPVGAHSVYRTLSTHAALTFAEISTALALAKHAEHLYHEPFEAAERHWLEQFAEGVETLAQNGTPEEALVVAEEPLGSWFARALESDASLGALFVPGATVRTFGASRAAALLAGHAPNPDLHLALAALFVNGRSRPGLYNRV
ncbi:MAG: hypothetical protein ABSE76_02470 [Minisyncoccia bacterium]|jgi:hypothetical protein